MLSPNFHQTCFAREPLFTAGISQARQLQPTNRRRARIGLQANIDSPNWMPTSIEDVKPILHVLRRHQRVICAMVAAELVLPVWEQWAGYRFGASAPRKAIVTLRKWLDIEATRDDVQVAREFCRKAIESIREHVAHGPVHHHAAEMAASSAFYACHHAASHGSAIEPSANGICAAIEAKVWLIPPGRNWRARAEQARREALAQWWGRCRQLLGQPIPARMQSA